MDLLFKCRRQLLHCVISWAWFCLVLLGSSLSNSQSTLVWDTQPTSQTVETGSTVTFLCSATYRRKVLQYRWKKDNKTIVTDSEPRFTVRDDGTLEITNVQVLDRGPYVCFVTKKDGNKALGESNPATLTVRGVCAAVQLVTRPSGSTFLTGTNLQFRCKCYMNPPGTFAFVKDGSAVATDSRITIDKHKLYINNATEKDSGTYSCSATSADSSVTKKPTEDLTISVIVGKDPQFLTSPPDKSVVLEGDQLSLPCTAVGNPGPLIKWYAGFDASPLQNDSKYTIFENDTLQIKSVTKQEAKVYKCTAENMVGSIVKDTEVELAYLGDVILEKAKLYVLINHRTEVLCGKPAGSPEPTITWEKADGEKLPDTFGVNGCCTLVKNRTKLKDSGSYTCVAKNIVGTSSKTIDIIVSEQPRINIKPDDQKVKEGEPVFLDCSATSTPAAKISWTKTTDGNQEKVEKGILPNGTLLITKAQPSDSGTYKCSADHPGGWTDSAEAKVVVMGSVKLKGFTYHVVNANLHKPLTIECNFVGFQPIKVTWKKDGGVQITDTDHMKQEDNVLKFDSIEKEDQGRYWCTGENKFSSAKSYVNVSVYVYPTFDLRPKNTTAYVDDHIWLHCNASGDPKPKISWSKDVPGGDKLDAKRFIQHANGTLHIKEVRLEDRGRYYCIAANHAEMKQSKFSLDVQNKADKFGQRGDDHPAEVEQSVGSMGRTIGIAVGCAAAYIVLVVGLMIYCKGRRARQNKRAEVLPPECETLKVNGEIEHGDPNDMTMNPVYRSQPSYDKMEFPRHDLDVLRSLGNGAYGRAFLARASGIRDGEKETMVIVKSLGSKDNQVWEEFNKEMEALCGLQHDNVVVLLGVCKDEEPIYMIFESMEKGDLKQFLLSCHDNGRSSLNSNQKLAICGQVAAGMNYLVSQDFVHKDLAARNCMVGRDLQVKIGFLSLSYDLYSAEYYRFNNMQIPLRWMPPEAIFDDEFSEKSDVWSYGVLVWEIYTFGQMPYRDRSNEEVLKCIKDDLRLAKPDNCPDTVLEVLEKCWEGNPLARPSFSELVDDMSGISIDSHV